MKKIILTTLTLALATFSHSKEPKEIIDTFFSHFPESMMNEAVDGVFASNPWMNRQEDQKTNFKTNLGSLEGLVGTYFGVDYVAEKRMGDNLIGYTYIARYDRQPVRFEFVFYKPNEEWLVYSFTYDDQVDEDLVEAMRKEIAYDR